MIKQNLLVLNVLFLSYIVLAQSVPGNYYLGNENKLAKTTQSNSGNPSSNSISDIVTEGNNVWLGTGKGLSLSTDRGETWENFYGTESFGENSASALGYDKYTGAFWAALAFSSDENGEDVQTGGGLVYTTDNGVTWTKIPQPVDDPGDSLLIYGINDGTNLPKVRALPVTVAQQNLTFDIAFTPGTVWISSFAGGLRKSTNMGVSWERVLLPSDNVNEISPDDTIRFSLQPVPGKFGSEGYLNHRLFSVASANETTLYVGSAGGINKSTDNGISWQKFRYGSQENSISGNFVVALAYDTLGHKLWGATWRAEGTSEFYGVSSTSDGGANWETFLDGEQVHNFGFKGSSVIAPSDNGAFRTTDEGTSWILPTAIIDNQTKVKLNAAVFYSAASKGSDVWLGSSDGLARLSETGFAWDGTWKVYIASAPLTAKTETYAYPNPFSPKLDLLKIKYSTGGKSSPVTIRIFDFGMNYIRTVIQNAERGDPVHVIDADIEDINGVIDYWDGKDDNGSVVPNGVYFYRVEIGSDEPVYGKILVVK